MAGPVLPDVPSDQKHQVVPVRCSGTERYCPALTLPLCFGSTKVVTHLEVARREEKHSNGGRTSHAARSWAKLVRTKRFH